MPLRLCSKPPGGRLAGSDFSSQGCFRRAGRGPNYESGRHEAGHVLGRRDPTCQSLQRGEGSIAVGSLAVSKCFPFSLSIPIPEVKDHSSTVADRCQSSALPTINPTPAHPVAGTLSL